ncbi:MAG: bifunctional folylpolyglutamate synthase/dihydrofolate synthase, partial [Lachnospiraceae bacterium]|nr:bifunctional folylpolyglutamate synthase/dihydrofolate synthase [Lachnospiraceae bacterium]
MRETEASNYNEAERFISQVPKFTVKNPLEETKKFYAFLQEEIKEEQLGKIIHVAGTNGKGSVCAFLQQIFLESGYHVGMFVSPHLVTTRERFVIDGEIVSEDAFVEAFNWLSAKINAYQAFLKDYTPTYFERLFFMGLYLFAKAGIRITVLETGLGGRLDTTNVIKNPALCVITEIGIDHTLYLGDTIEQIAYEKAGIIKPNVPVVFWERNKEAFDVLMKKASDCGSQCFIVSKNEYKINE